MEESRKSVSHAPQGTGNVERRQTLSGPSRCPPDARLHRPPHGPVPPMARATTDARGGGPALRRPGGPCRLVDQGSRGGLAGARGARRARDHTHQARTTPRALEAGSRLPRRHGTLRGGNRLAETGCHPVPRPGDALGLGDGQTGAWRAAPLPRPRELARDGLGAELHGRTRLRVSRALAHSRRGSCVHRGRGPRLPVPCVGKAGDGPVWVEVARRCRG